MTTSTAQPHRSDCDPGNCSTQHALAQDALLPDLGCTRPAQSTTLQRFRDLLDALEDHRHVYTEDGETDQQSVASAVSNLMDDHGDGGWVTGIVSAEFLAALLTEVETGQPAGEV